MGRLISFLKMTFAQSWSASRSLSEYEAFGLVGIVHWYYKYESIVISLQRFIKWIANLDCTIKWVYSYIKYDRYIYYIRIYSSLTVIECFIIRFHLHIKP